MDRKEQNHPTARVQAHRLRGPACSSPSSRPVRPSGQFPSLWWRRRARDRNVGCAGSGPPRPRPAEFSVCDIMGRARLGRPGVPRGPWATVHHGPGGVPLLMLVPPQSLPLRGPPQRRPHAPCVGPPASTLSHKQQNHRCNSSPKAQPLPGDRAASSQPPRPPGFPRRQMPVAPPSSAHTGLHRGGRRVSPPCLDDPVLGWETSHLWEVVTP